MTDREAANPPEPGDPREPGLWRGLARAIVYLSCDDSAGVTGTSLVVDGGYLAAAEWDAG